VTVTAAGTGTGEKRRAAEIVVTGSLAYDYIMNYSGDLRDHIMPDKVHVLSISILVQKLNKQRGGTAGNMAYTLALLGQPCTVLATAGAEDFETYRAYLVGLGVDTGGITLLPDDLTASYFAFTDMQNNTVGGFYEGAMRRSDRTTFRDFAPDSVRVALVGPTVPEGIARFPRECRELGIPFVYNPAWQTAVMGAADLADGLTGAAVFLGSDYEVATVAEKTGLSEDDMLARLAPDGALVKTLGGEGSHIRTRDAEYHIPVAPAKAVVDPTGGGDAYTAGLLVGLQRGWGWERTGRVAALAATYTIEQYGPQAHTFTADEFAARYEDAFGSVPGAES